MPGLLSVLINVDRLKRTPWQTVLHEPVTAFSGLNELADDGSVVFTRAICGTLTARRVEAFIEVSGLLESSVVMPCSRCLADVDCELVVDVALCYGSGVADSRSDVEEVEISSDELGLIVFSGDEIDLRPDVEQEILMALPLQPLCKTDCLGLCPVCGASRNQSKCGCVPPVFHGELGRLKDFKPKNR